MIRYFFRLLKGYVRIQIKSISPEYFLERCRINGIFFWELVCLKKGEYQCSLFLKDFYRLRGCARGKGVRLRICERRGLPFFLQRNRKRWYAAAGLSSFFLLLYMNYIWAVKPDIVHMGYPFSGQSPLYCRYVGALSGYTGCALWDEKEKDKL